MKKLIKTIFLFVVMMGVGVCDSQSLIQDLGNRAIQTLTNSTASLSEVETQFVSLLEEGFDVPNISNFVLAQYWKQATPEQQDRFIKIFKNRLKKAYASRFREYRGVKFTVGATSHRSGSDYVKSTIQKASGPVTDVEWRVKHGKIQDVIVDGISMSVTLRDDYRSLLAKKNGDIEAFLKELEVKN